MQEKTFKEIWDELCKTWKVIDKGYKNIRLIQHPNRPITLAPNGDLYNIKKDEYIYTFNRSKNYKYKVLPNNIIVEPEGVIAINLS